MRVLGVILDLLVAGAEFLFGWVARAFDLAGIIRTVGALFLRVLGEGWESEMPAPTGI